MLKAIGRQVEYFSGYVQSWSVRVQAQASMRQAFFDVYVEIFRLFVKSCKYFAEEGRSMLDLFFKS